MAERVKIAIVGCGGMGRRHLAGLAELARSDHNNVDLVAVCDLNRQNADQRVDDSKCEITDAGDMFDPPRARFDALPQGSEKSTANLGGGGRHRTIGNQGQNETAVGDGRNSDTCNTRRSKIDSRGADETQSLSPAVLFASVWKMPAV